MAMIVIFGFSLADLIDGRSSRPLYFSREHCLVMIRQNSLRKHAATCYPTLCKLLGGPVSTAPQYRAVRFSRLRPTARPSIHVYTHYHQQFTGKAEPTAAQTQAVIDHANEVIANDLPCSRFTMLRTEAEAAYGTAM